MKCEAVLLVAEERDLFLQNTFQAILLSAGRKKKTILKHLLLFLHFVAPLKKKKATFSMSASLSCPWPAALLVVQSKLTARVNDENLNVATGKREGCGPCAPIDKFEGANRLPHRLQTPIPTAEPASASPSFKKRQVKIHFPTFAVVPHKKQEEERKKPSPCHFLLSLIFFPPSACQILIVSRCFQRPSKPNISRCTSDG